MRVQLVNNCHKYSGYQHLDINQFKELADNCCDEIIAYGFIHDVKLADLAHLFSLLNSKLRKNGELSFNFVNYLTIDPYAIDVPEFNAIVNCTCLTIEYMKEFCEEHGLKVLNWDTDGHETTMRVKR